MHLGDTGRIEQLLREVVADDFAVQHFLVKLSLRVGMALYPDDACTLEDLIRIADTRMYQAKEGKSGSREEIPPESS